MKYSDLISGIFWLGLGFLLAIWSTHYPIGSITEPGPGFLPLGLGLILIFLSLVLLGQAKKSFVQMQKSPSFFMHGWRQIAFTVLTLFLSIYLFEKIGYLFTIFIFIALLHLGSGSKSWKKILLVSFLCTLGVYSVFVLLLKQPLPRGFLRF